MDVLNKHIVVIGAARSGVAAAILLQKKGAKVFVTDASAIQPDLKKRLIASQVSFEESGHSDFANKGEMVVMSPGVPTTAPLVQDYLKRDIPVYSEIEAASWFSDGRMVAVTGSNGKTTVSSWLAHMWKTAQRKNILAGNIGLAFSDQISSVTANTDIILEVSSFQLDHIDTFKPAISVILNITPDHMDRYNYNFDAYAASKCRITENQNQDDFFIYNYDDPVLIKHAEQLSKRNDAPQLLAFSNIKEVPNGAFVRNDHIILKINQTEETLMHIGEVGLSGKHNLSNGLATALAARASEIKNDLIRESLQTFEGVEHRLEKIREIDGVRYINDSKATNVNAVWYALDSFNVPMVLILGGRDKGNDYTELADQIRDKVHTIIAIGEAKEKIKQQLGKTVPNMMEADDMKKAVVMARKQAKRGEIVLLSPACASFDMFNSYEHRGDVFRQAVLEL